VLPGPARASVRDGRHEHDDQREQLTIYLPSCSVRIDMEERVRRADMSPGAGNRTARERRYAACLTGCPRRALPPRRRSAPA
jgi:hypothetical protein